MWCLDLGPLPRVRGSIYKKKLFRTQVQIRNTRRSFDPPPPKRGVPAYGGGVGGGGSKSKNSLGDHFLSQNENFYKGSDIRYDNLWYATRTTPKGVGGIRRLRLRFT